MERWYHKYVLMVWGVYLHELQARFYGIVLLDRLFVGIAFNAEQVAKVVNRLNG